MHCFNRQRQRQVGWQLVSNSTKQRAFLFSVFIPWIWQTQSPLFVLTSNQELAKHKITLRLWRSLTLLSLNPSKSRHYINRHNSVCDQVPLSQCQMAKPWHLWHHEIWGKVSTTPGSTFSRSADSLLNLSTEVKSGSLVVTFENLGNVTKDKLEGLPSQVHPVPPF